nr:hypothetical protein [uncultured Cohaesibacter sp.]
MRRAHVISSGLLFLEGLVDEKAATEVFVFVEEAKSRVQEEINKVLEQQEEQCANQEDGGDWDVFSTSIPFDSHDEIKTEVSLRSIYEDVDSE